jgi:hypothetical protein
VNSDFYNSLDKNDNLLDRLLLFTKGRKRAKGLPQVGHYGILESNDEVVDLGTSIDVLPLARRPKAIDMSNTVVVTVNYDFESDEFKRIVAQSLERKSHCMYGVSFLVYEMRSGRFLEFYCGTKSTRREAKNIYPFLPLTSADIRARRLEGVEPHGPMPVTFKVKLVTRGKFSLHVPKVAKCSTPFEPMPAPELIDAEIATFIGVL